MKKTMLAAALAALAIGSASADTIYITGSTAFRKAANDAIQYYVTNTKSGSLVASDSGDNGAGNAVWNYDTTNYIVAYWSGSEAGIQSVAGPAAIGYKTAYNTFTTNISTFTNTVKPTNLVVGGAWTGVAGNWTNKVIVTNSITNTIASQPNLLSFWDPTQSFLVNGTKKATNSTFSYVSAVANIAFSDTLQASSAFGGGKTVAYFATNNLDDTQTTNAAYYGIKTPTNRSVVCASNSYVTITNDIPVGVVGFGFIVSGNAAPSQSAFSNSVIANITKAQAADLYKKGKVNLAEYTGALSDTNRFVYAMGRRIDSGTRLVTFSMLGLGSTVTNNSLDNGVNTGINQYLILGTNSGLNAANSASSASVFVKADGTSITNTNSMIITNFPADVTVGKLCATGHNGYASGGNLCKSIGAITAANSPGNAVAIGYAGIPDASGYATVIAYEGVYPSTESIKSGSYPFWSVEHILVHNDAPQSIQDAASGIADQIKKYSTSDLQSRAKCTVALADVTNNVTRTVDGGTITKSWTNGVTLTNLPSYYTTSKQSSAGAGIGF
jgi:hypothetical protein